MPRARNIKHGFFMNEVLAEVDPLGRLLFIALWTLADRAGRLDERIKRIKIEALPFDDCDVDALLAQLAERRFIQRYVVGDKRLIQIVNFSKHQNPHKNELQSTRPPPPDERPAPC